jgi:hypothetical protein
MTMDQLNRYYVITDLADDVVEDYARMKAVATELRAIDDAGFGSRTVLIRFAEEFAEHGIDEALYTTHTGGKLPIIYVGMAYLPDSFDVGRLTSIEQKFGLTLLLESK